MKKLLLTTGVIAALAGSQMGFAACVGPAETCDSTVTLNVAKLVVLKGLDDYDFSNPAANGWDGTNNPGSKAEILGAICIGRNNTGFGVDVTFTSASGNFNVIDGALTVPYTLRFDGAAIASGATVGVTDAAKLENLVCANEQFPLNVEFAGGDLLGADPSAAYTDTITVTVATQ